MKLKITLAIATLISFSCAPKIEEKKPTPSILASGPRHFDKNLSAAGSNAFATKEFATDKMQMTENELQQLEHIENLYSLAKLENSTYWKNKASEGFFYFSKDHTFADLKLEDSVYADIVDKKIGATVTEGVLTADVQLQKDVEIVAQAVRKLQQEEFFISLESSLPKKLKATAEFIEKLLLKVESLDILPEFKTLFVQQVKQKSDELIVKATALDSAIVQSKNLVQIIKHIDAYVLETQTELTPEDLKDLADGRKLAKMIENTSSAKNGLATMAMVWIILDPQQRVESIKSENAELYKFFNEKGPSDIRCIANKNCESFITKIVLNVGVYPALEEYGIKNLKNTLNTKSKEFVIAKINQVAYDSLLALCETVISEVSESVALKRAELQSFSQNLNTVLKTNLQTFFKSKEITELKSNLLNADGTAASVNLQNLIIRNKINMLPEWHLESDLIKTQFEILEHVLKMPVFSKAVDERNDDSDSLQANEPLSKENLANLILSPAPRQYLENLPAEKSGENKQSTNTVRLKDQSDALLTTSKIIRELVDWKSSSFDSNLSAVLANQIITEFKTSDLEKPFFNKADLFALMLSLSSQTLKLLEDEKSPLILIDNSQKVVFIQDFTADSGPLALAAATDFIGNDRDLAIRAKDLSYFQLALIEFYSATEGLEKTSSVVLRQEVAGEPSLLKQITDARIKIKTLIIAIGNFLSNQMVQENGLIKNEFLLSDKMFDGPAKEGSAAEGRQLEIKSDYQLQDQTAVIEALVLTYELTDIDVYLWSALDIYYSMNHKMYNVKNKFYSLNLEAALADKSSGAKEVSGAKDKLSVSVISSTYKSLAFLKPYLSGDSQRQFDSIFEGWLKNL